MTSLGGPPQGPPSWEWLGYSTTAALLHALLLEVGLLFILHLREFGFSVHALIRDQRAFVVHVKNL